MIIHKKRSRLNTKKKSRSVKCGINLNIFQILPNHDFKKIMELIRSTDNQKIIMFEVTIIIEYFALARTNSRQDHLINKANYTIFILQTWYNDEMIRKTIYKSKNIGMPS